MRVINRRSPTEHAEACAFAAWLGRRGHLYLHVPNEGKRHPATARRMKAEGMKPGAPDYLIFARVPEDTAIRGIAVEMKRQAPNYRGPTLSQRAWLESLARDGWATYVARGAEDAIEFCQGIGL